MYTLCRLKCISGPHATHTCDHIFTRLRARWIGCELTTHTHTYTLTHTHIAIRIHTSHIQSSRHTRTRTRTWLPATPLQSRTLHPHRPRVHIDWRLRSGIARWGTARCGRRPASPQRSRGDLHPSSHTRTHVQTHTYAHAHTRTHRCRQARTGAHLTQRAATARTPIYIMCVCARARACFCVGVSPPPIQRARRRVFVCTHVCVLASAPLIHLSLHSV